MEDFTSPSNLSPPATRSADALRDVHSRAQAAMAAQRERIARLESQLTQQIDDISAAVADQLSTGTQNANEVDRWNAEADALRCQLTEATAAWEAERFQLNADVSDRTRQLDERLLEVDTQAAQLAASRHEVESRQQVLDDRMSQLNAQDRELRKRREDVDAEAQRVAGEQASLGSTQRALEQLRADLASREADVHAEDARLEHDRAEIVSREQAWQAERSAIVTERDHLAANIAAIQQQSQSADSELAVILASTQAEFQKARTAWETELNQLRKVQAAHDLIQQNWDDDRAQWQSLKASLESQLLAITQERDEQTTSGRQVSQQLRELREQLNSQLAGFHQQLANEQESWGAERATLEDRCHIAERKRDELAASLATAGTQIEAARALSVAANERDELRQKFELALADVHRLRSRTAELEQELSSRPAADAGDSVELVHLRSERDALAARIAELEQQPAAVVSDADTAQEIADLQRRFELAVEDVRDLKRKNSQLETQLIELNSRTGASCPVVPAAGSSWEALKQKMLASLEGESDDGDVERQRERASIEDTIRITDEVVASKDREISALRAQLAEGGPPAAAEDESLRELVDNDAVILQHRERIAQIEREMEDKLRAAELELSIERAKIAREQVQLADLKAEIDAVRGTPVAGNGAGLGQPKRRWMSKLGLGGEEEK